MQSSMSIDVNAELHEMIEPVVGNRLPHQIQEFTFAQLQRHWDHVRGCELQNTQEMVCSMVMTSLALNLPHI